MISSRAAVFLCLLCGSVSIAQDANPAGTARANLEGLAAKGDARALATALGRRGGDWFDVVLSAVADPMPPIDPTKALVAALPEPEQKGLKALLEQLAAAPAATRQNFATALGALTALTRTFSDTKSDPKSLSDAIALAGDRIKTADNEWLTARGAVARAIGRFDTSLADIEPELAAAVEKLTAMGDRFDAAFAAAFQAKALADKGELDKAFLARENAQALFKALGAIDKGGPAVRGTLARVDLALAPAFFDDARDDAALDACARARTHFKTADPMRDLEASATEAAILIDRGNPAGAIETTKGHVAKVPQIKDKAILTRFSVAVATALRLTGKAPAGLEFLRKAVGRAKELGMTPNEESPLRMAMALVYIQSQQSEAAHAALEVVAKFAEDPMLKPLARAAALNRAILYQAQGGREAEVPKQLANAEAIPLGGPTIERVATAGPQLSLAEALIDQGKPKDALKYIRDASTLSEELGVRLEDVRIATTTVATVGREPLHVRLGVAIGSYENAGQDWAGFEPVFVVSERRLQDVLAKGVPGDNGPADMAERLRESDRQVLKLRRSAAGARAPLSEEEARRIVAFRRVIIDEAWSRAPTFALRRFPRAGSIKRAKDNYCGVEGAIFGATVTDQTAYAYCFSRDRFNFSALNVALRVHDALAGFASVAKDPKSTPAAWISASAPLWEHLILKQIPVFEDKKWLAICPDPSIEGIPIEALVPGDAKSDSFRTLPYLMQKIAVGRVPITSFALEQRNRRNQAWLTEPFAAIILGPKDKLETGIPFAQAFDPAIKPDAPITEKAGVFRLGEPGDGTDSAPSKRARIMVFGHGISDQAVGWRAPTPSVVCVLDPPSQKEGSNVLLGWMIRGARAVIAPNGPIEKPVVDALMVGTLKAFGQDGVSPIEALSAGKRAFLSTTSKSAFAGVTDAHYHPFHWTQLQAWLVNP